MSYFFAVLKFVYFPPNCRSNH